MLNITMIDLTSIPLGSALLLSGGPASTFMAYLLRDRSPCIITLESRTWPTEARALAVLEYLRAEYGGFTEHRSIKLVDMVERTQGLWVVRDQLRVSELYPALVTGTLAASEILDPARRAREQGHVAQDFLYINTSTALPRQGLNRPMTLKTLSRDSNDTWVREPLRAMTLADLAREYQQLGLGALWAETRSCWALEACVKCWDCRARSWAETTAGLVS